MSFFDLDKSLKSARERLDQAAPRRKRRADAGGTRLPDPILEELRRLVGGLDRPPMRAIERDLRAFCEARALRPPSRATLYRLIQTLAVHHYRVADLPPPARAALYNLDADALVPGHQLAFYAFNYGDTRAMSFAAALPWIDLYQAARMRGWRAMSLGPLRAALHVRGIE